jgi:hypothetical protein
MRWAGHVAHMVQLRKAGEILLRKLDGKRQLARPGDRCEDNINLDLK